MTNEITSQDNYWTRTSGGWVAGVFKGMAQNFGVEVWILRAAFLISFFCFGFGLLIYLLLWISLPKKDQMEKAHQRRLLGVCKDLALKYDIEVGLLRFLACLLAISSLGTAIVIYVIVHIVMPKDQIQKN